MMNVLQAVALEQARHKRDGKFYSCTYLLHPPVSARNNSQSSLMALASQTFT